MSRITAIYHVREAADQIDARAHTIAVEQSVEMPVSAIADERVLSDIVGKVTQIDDLGSGVFQVKIGLATETTGLEPGQLMNMAFGNTSIHADVTLADIEFPSEVAAAFGGPNQGLEGWRARCGAENRGMTCSALKPQGLPAKALGRVAHQMALGGLDFIKDDHGLADQAYSPFADRVDACSDAVATANAQTGGKASYVPSLSGHLDQLREQVARGKERGLDTFLIAPMITGLAAFRQLSRENPEVAFMAHPALAGASHILPSLLLGKIFRVMGADATIFPNHGGRFGYSPQTCKTLAETALTSGLPVKSCVPIPAGGMTVDRVPEMLDFYGQDVMLVIGGGLLSAGAKLTEQTALFTDKVKSHSYA